MRSRLVAMLITLAVCLSVCVFCLMSLSRVMDAADEMCVQAVRQAEAGDIQGGLETLTQFAEKWHRWSALMETMTSHEDLSAVQSQLVDAKMCLEQGDLEEFHRASAQLGEAIHHIRDQEDIRFSNLF